VLLGDGELRSSLESQVSRLGLQGSVLLPGFKQYPELPEYYARAGAFIHASTTEQWGLVVNEAMASGLPVLVSNRCGCARDLVQDGVNGFTFDPYNVEQMAELMVRVWTMESGAEVGGQRSEVRGRATVGSAPATGAVLRALAENPGGFAEGVESNSRGGCAPRLSTINSQPSTSLAEMGAASQRIISDWGPERFAAGLKQAVECAMRVGPVKATIVQRMILRALLAR
jgi:glycosyltransferase involved in cell wall biosynthesis